MTKDGSVIKKTKGIDSSNITLENYKNMYKYNKMIIGKRKESYKNYLEGYVRIYDKNFSF